MEWLHFHIVPYPSELELLLLKIATAKYFMHRIVMASEISLCLRNDRFNFKQQFTGSLVPSQKKLTISKELILITACEKKCFLLLLCVWDGNSHLKNRNENKPSLSLHTLQ